MLKQHWSETKEDTISCPITVLGSREKPKGDQGGLVCLLNDQGKLQQIVELSMPAGMVRSDNGIFVASIDTIHEFTTNLVPVQQDIVSLPAFNLLHSLSRSQHGYLAASTGLDVILEFDRTGQLLWEWWATEHGFAHTPTGELREIDKSVDYRGIKFGTLAQTTHVNSASELPDGTILATLFHQGMIIAIDRATGNWRPVLEDLDHPHAVRVLAENYISVADTKRGRALLVRLDEQGKGHIEHEVVIDCTWLQDAYYDQRNDMWFLVDGQNTRLVLRSGPSGEKVVNEIQLDPEWRLYEVLPL
ncbi:MAG TPA: hypothetical protein VL485_09650 [Ktedonobacteraceae bacterium]|jgi:hypothetical protein|nr:hypothetical protein [Ktedonobacteraceae bacterium]